VATWRPEPTSGWPAFVAWTFCGALWTVSVLSQVGLFTLPLAVVLTWLLIRYSRDRRDAIGLVAGVAAFLLYVGSAHIGQAPCPESGMLTLPPGAEGSVSCTNFVETPLACGRHDPPSRCSRSLSDGPWTPGGKADTRGNIPLSSSTQADHQFLSKTAHSTSLLTSWVEPATIRFALFAPGRIAR